MTTSTTRPMEADAHLLEHVLALGLIVLEAMLTLIVAAIALALTISGWRPAPFPRKSEETPQGKGSQPITSPGNMPHVGQHEPLQDQPEAADLPPAPPATAAPRRKAAKARKPTAAEPQPGQAASPRARRQRSAAVG